MAPIRVLLADDRKLFADSIKIVLEGYERDAIRVVGLAYDGKEAVELAARTRPDVVLLDVRMPVMDGVEASRQIHARHPEIKIIMLTTFQEDELVRNALSNGAVGYVLKEVQPRELVESIKLANGGFYLISPSVGGRLLRRAAAGSPADPERDAALAGIQAAFPELSRREAEVLAYISRSYDNHEIARELFLAEQTVKNHVTSIYTKLGVKDRVHCVRLLNERLDARGGRR